MLDRSFCASPWLHMRIDPQGNFKACRWQSDRSFDAGNIADTSVLEFFQHSMAPLRQQLLDGQAPQMCSTCAHMEQHSKISGRQRQLLKIGVDTNRFSKTLASSPFLSSLRYSHDHQGLTDLLPQDWQIDLGNHCNSACLFCQPAYSTRLAQDYLSLGLIDRVPGPNWTDDDQLVDRFCLMLSQSPGLAYLHFLGGETLIIPAFQKILSKLADHDMTKVHIGFTTNLTVWPGPVISLLERFSNVHAGLSVECLHSLNDYMRWPSKIQQVRKTLDRWIDHGRRFGWMLQIRPTPSCLTVGHITDLYKFAIDNSVGVETCNFIRRPEFFRINALPPDLLQRAKQKVQDFLHSQDHDPSSPTVVNTRNQNTLKQQVLQDAQSYLNYLETESHDPRLMTPLVDWLKTFESRRGNCILDHAPEYEEFLRAAGY